MLKYHIQTSGRSLHAQEVQFNDIRTTLQVLLQNPRNTDFEYLGNCWVGKCSISIDEYYWLLFSGPPLKSLRGRLDLSPVLRKDWPETIKGIARRPGQLQLVAYERVPPWWLALWIRVIVHVQSYFDTSIVYLYSVTPISRAYERAYSSQCELSSSSISAYSARSRAFCFFLPVRFFCRSWQKIDVACRFSRQTRRSERKEEKR